MLFSFGDFISLVSVKIAIVAAGIGAAAAAAGVGNWQPTRSINKNKNTKNNLANTRQLAPSNQQSTPYVTHSIHQHIECLLIGWLPGILPTRRGKQQLVGLSVVNTSTAYDATYDKR